MIPAGLGPQHPGFVRSDLVGTDGRGVKSRKRRAQGIALYWRHGRRTTGRAAYVRHLGISHQQTAGPHRHCHGGRNLPASEQGQQEQQMDQPSCGKASHGPNYAHPSGGLQG